jgi:hypothetical protein
MQVKQEEVIVKAPNPTPIDEIFDARSPDEIEAELVLKAESAALNAATNMAPADRAAMFFQAMYPQFEHSLNGLSRKELMKVCAAIVHYPLEEAMPKTDAGDQALGLGLKLVDAKLVMRETIAIEEMEKLKGHDGPLTPEAQEIVNDTEIKFEQGETVNAE